MRNELIAHELFGHALVNAITLDELGCDLPINIISIENSGARTGIRFCDEQGTTLHWQPSSRTATNAIAGAIAGSLFELLETLHASKAEMVVDMLRNDLQSDEKIQSFIENLALQHYTMSEADKVAYQNGHDIEYDVLRQVISAVINCFDADRVFFLEGIGRCIKQNGSVEFMPGELIDLVNAGRMFPIQAKLKLDTSKLKLQYIQAVVDNKTLFSSKITDLMDSVPPGIKLRLKQAA